MLGVDASPCPRRLSTDERVSALRTRLGNTHGTCGCISASCEPLAAPLAPGTPRCRIAKYRFEQFSHLSRVDARREEPQRVASGETAGPPGIAFAWLQRGHGKDIFLKWDEQWMTRAHDTRFSFLLEVVQ